MFGLEMHLAQIHRIVEDFDPANVVVDPITSLLHSGTVIETSSMLLRLIDFLKAKSITAMMTTVTSRGADVAEQSGTTISSLIDAWLLLRDIEMGGERNRGLYVLKARGIAHSNQIREFLLTKRGIELRDVYLGDAGLLTGSARVTQEARDNLAALNRQQEIDRKKWLLERKRRLLESQIASLQMDMESDALEVHQLEVQTRQTLAKLAQDRAEMATSRLAGRALHPPNGRAAASNGGRR
jgi:circadian clock protein KaiC